MNIPTSVIAIVFSANGSQVLLTKRRDVPVWVLPGGGIEPHESPETAAVREVLEETGFHVTVYRLVGIYSPINRLAKLTHLYECCILSGQATLSPETKEVRFFPIENLPKEIPPPYPDWIQDALQQQRTPIQKKLTQVTYLVLLQQLIKHPILVLRFLLSRIGLNINT
jgi:8-oxo-dGTP diphosphatase